MALARVFESGAEPPDRGAELARLRLLLADTGTVPERRTQDAQGTGVPVPELLRPLLPAGQLERGGIVSVADRVPPVPGLSGPGYLALALAAGASAGGSWCAVVGMPELGIAALSGLGADLTKFLLVDHPGERWPEAVAVLAGAVDLILLRPPARPSAAILRRVVNRIRVTERQRGCALLVSGPWDGAHLTLRVTEAEWSGLGQGTGNLTERRVTIVSDGRRAAGRARTVQALLPAADGSLAAPAAADGTREEVPARLRIA